ncbi:MAG: LptF/LptG family permease [Gemmatimonadetes bacterium]|nr:LptF/LptG family permease [Gemmatimonadota bacterium]
MRILTRYLLKAHLGPFLFALTALTGLLFLNAVAQRLEDLAGKGLTLDVILEFMVLSLPHTVALTLPMAVLVAVLYAFAELTSSNELTAMKAGGIRPQRILMPLVVGGVVMAGVMLYFNDRVLPEANHALAQLLVDIGRKSPTFDLREQVVNEVSAGEGASTVFLTARSIDRVTNEMEDVVIFDPSDLRAHRTTYADRGSMAFNEARTDLYLTLYDGVTYETDGERRGGFQQVRFARQVVPLRGVGNELDRRAGVRERSDREMSIGMLAERANERQAEIERVREESARSTREAVLLALGRTEEVDSTAAIALGTRRHPEAAARLEAARAPAGGQATPERSLASRDEVTRRAALAARTAVTRADALGQTVNKYRVEIHKKYTLAFACIVFVLVGAPLAVRFPRGGLGLVIGASSIIFAIYWMGLIGGEKLADRGIASPAVTMWIPNLVFLVVGLWLVARMGREAATNRGGGWEELAGLLARPFRRSRSAP